MSKRYMISATVLLLTAMPALAGKLNLNEASPTKLEQLDGVGEVKAQAIVDYRQSQGPFQSVDQLTEVDGIGEATLEDNRERLTAKPVE